MVGDFNVLISKAKNFSGYFEVSEDELHELLMELRDAKKRGIPLETLLRR